MRLKSEQVGSVTHISHMWHYISAYHYSADGMLDLKQRIEKALEVAKATLQVQIVDDDGEMCFHVTPRGYIILMLPWQKFTLANEDGSSA